MLGLLATILVYFLWEAPIDDLTQPRIKEKSEDNALDGGKVNPHLELVDGVFVHIGPDGEIIKKNKASWERAKMLMKSGSKNKTKVVNPFMQPIEDLQNLKINFRVKVPPNTKADVKPTVKPQPIFDPTEETITLSLETIKTTSTSKPTTSKPMASATTSTPTQTQPENSEPDSMAEILGPELDPNGNYVVISANNHENDKNTDFGNDYAYSLYYAVLGWKAAGFGSVVFLPGNNTIWKKEEPFKTIVDSLLKIDNVIVILFPCPTRFSRSMAQFGRLFVHNFFDKEKYKNVYLITSDADLFPLMPDSFNLVPKLNSDIVKGFGSYDNGKYDIVLSNSMGVWEKKTGIPSDMKDMWMQHGLNNPDHQAPYVKFRTKTDMYEHREDDPHYGLNPDAKMVKMGKMVRSRQQRDVEDEDSDHETEDQKESDEPFNPNREIDSKRDWGEDWINKIMQADRDKRMKRVYFRTLYTALSCVGAKIDTWYDLMNFHDCQDFNHDVRKLPVRWKKIVTGDNIRQPKKTTYHQTYRVIDYTTGCWKRYDKVDTAKKIVDYLEDAIGIDVLNPVLGRNNSRAVGRSGDGWYIDQALVSLRLGQWGKRQGYERLRMTNVGGLGRVARGPNFWDWNNQVNALDYPSTKIYDAHLYRRSFKLKPWWNFIYLMETVVRNSTEVNLMKNYHWDYLEACRTSEYLVRDINITKNANVWIKDRNQVNDIVQAFKNITGDVNVAMVRTDFFPIQIRECEVCKKRTQCQGPKESYYEDVDKYAVYKDSKIYEYNLAGITGNCTHYFVVDRWKGKNQFVEEGDWPRFCRQHGAAEADVVKSWYHNVDCVKLT